MLGSTGSIGLNSIGVIEALGDEYELIAVSAHRHWQALAEQARRHHLEKVVLTDPAGGLGALREALAGFREHCEAVGLSRAPQVLLEGGLTEEDRQRLQGLGYFDGEPAQQREGGAP